VQHQVAVLSLQVESASIISRANTCAKRGWQKNQPDTNRPAWWNRKNLEFDDSLRKCIEKVLSKLLAALDKPGRLLAGEILKFV